jgi:hypothetical protein
VLRKQRAMFKGRWTGIMRAAGISDEDMLQWHREFEDREPRAHQEFLESLHRAVSWRARPTAAT